MTRELREALIHLRRRWGQLRRVLRRKHISLKQATSDDPHVGPPLGRYNAAWTRLRRVYVRGVSSEGSWKEEKGKLQAKLDASLRVIEGLKTSLAEREKENLCLRKRIAENGNMACFKQLCTVVDKLAGCIREPKSSEVRALANHARGVIRKFERPAPDPMFEVVSGARPYNGNASLMIEKIAWHAGLLPYQLGELAPPESLDIPSNGGLQPLIEAEEPWLRSWLEDTVPYKERLPPSRQTESTPLYRDVPLDPIVYREQPGFYWSPSLEGNTERPRGRRIDPYAVAELYRERAGFFKDPDTLRDEVYDNVRIYAGPEIRLTVPIPDQLLVWIQIGWVSVLYSLTILGLPWLALLARSPLWSATVALFSIELLPFLQVPTPILNRRSMQTLSRILVGALPLVSQIICET